MSLPRILPAREGLDVEDDPEVLHSRACALWEQWQRLDRKDGTAAKSYPKTVVKAAVVRLVDQHSAAGIPIPYELTRLIRAIVDPDDKATSLSVRADHQLAFWSAIRFEAAASKPSVYAIAKHLRDEGRHLHDEGRCLTEPEAYLASLAWQDQKSVESTVRAWQERPDYQANVRLYRPKPWLAPEG